MATSSVDDRGHVADSRRSRRRFLERRLLSFASREYALTIVIVAICVLFCWLSKLMEFADANGVMIYLAGVALVAAKFGHGPAILSAFLSVISFLFFFIPPIFGFQAADTQYFIVLAVMLGIGLLISELTAQLQSQLRAAQQREHHTAQLYQMTLQLNENSGDQGLAATAGRCVAEILKSEVLIYLRGSDDSLARCFGEESAANAEREAASIARWVIENKQSAGAGTEHFSHLRMVYVPMIGSQETVGVLAADRRDGSQIEKEDRGMLATCANLIALSIERDRSREDAQKAQVLVHTEQLRNSLLSAVSHDLRTPLSMIAVTASSLLRTDGETDPAMERENLQVMIDETGRLSRQVDNLLDMAQLQSGTIKLKRDWHVLEELLGIALTRMRPELKQRTVAIEIPDSFPLVWVDEDLAVQMLVNLLDNAVRYAPAGCRIEISAKECGDKLRICVADNGRGLPPGVEETIFEKFVRASGLVADGQRGMGLGLAICRSITELHEGSISARTRVGGGAEFVILLPRHAENTALEVSTSALHV